MSHNNKRVEDLNDKEVRIESFKRYENSDDGLTKKVNGDLKIESFHVYKSEDEDEDNLEY